MSKGTASPGLGSLLTGTVTAAALAVQTGLAAVVGVVIAREFGRGAETDGFFAAYGIFIVLLLAAAAVRVTVLPAFARAREARGLSAETVAYGLALAVAVAPIMLAAVTLDAPIADVLTGDGPPSARDTAAELLPWMVLAAVLQLYAGVCASALAALDDYAVAAAGFVVGSAVGLAFILLRVDEDGIIAVAWGMALNGAIALAVPAGALALRAQRERMPSSAARPRATSLASRLSELGVGIALPLALQAIYLVCLPLAAREGVGAQTSFGYAYLIAAGLVGVTASSLGIVTAVPLTRAGLDPAGTVRHVVASSWLALAVIAGSAGVFGIAGESIAREVLGSAYGSEVGSELGRLVVALSLWAVVSVGVSVTFPLVFVVGRARGLPLTALAAVALHVPVALTGQLVGGLDGLAVALAVSTGIVLAWLLAQLRAAGALRGLAIAASVVAALALAAFVPSRVLLGPVAAAAVGLVLYAALLAALRPRGLRSAWRYLRALG